MHGSLPVNARIMNTRLIARPDKVQELLQTLAFLREEIRAQPGCLGCSISQAAGIGLRIQVFTVWEELPYLEAHLASDLFRVLLGASAVLARPASFQFITADRWSAGSHGLPLPDQPSPLP